jgi:hypothetical protein
MRARSQLDLLVVAPLYRADKSAIMGTKTGLDRRSPLQLAVE